MTGEVEFDFADPFIPELISYTKQEGLFSMLLETPPETSLALGALTVVNIVLS